MAPDRARGIGPKRVHSGFGGAGACYVGQTGKLAIALVLAAGFLGAVLGDNFSFYIGQKFGFQLLRRYGHFVRLIATWGYLAVFGATALVM